jgi:2-phosphosulfolactate phosphatase
MLSQDRWDVRCEWGAAGVPAVASTSDVLIVVDVLSFSTCVETAVSRGAEVFPFRWKDARAEAFAREIGAELAGARGTAGYSLSPASFSGVPSGTRVVLPSPNGATLSLVPTEARVMAGCLRNAAAVARAAQAVGRRIAVIPAGERWPDETLRPCLEDWLGAGAILSHLGGPLSPEAEAARATFQQLESNLARVIGECASGRQLREWGYPEDVAVSSELDVSEVVPVLQGRAYRRG